MVTIAVATIHPELTIKRINFMTVDIIIPVYKPDDKLVHLIERLQQQDYEIQTIRLINTRSQVPLPDICRNPYPVEITEIEVADFDHGATRNMGAKSSSADLLIFMTQDAIPANSSLVSTFVQVFEKYQDLNIAYGRQLPNRDCNVVERFTRRFNYPEESKIKSIQDLQTMGIKTFFFSDVCGAYRRRPFLQRGGFESPMIFGEDLVHTARCVLDGERVAYVAEAKVYHSHNYNCMQQFHRNFDGGVVQAIYSDIFENVPSEGEGIKLVKETATYLIRIGKPLLLVELFFQSAFKYAGFFLGKRYQRLPKGMVRWCSSNPGYFVSKL